ncbi:NAD-dependent epimerase/dehydratase family protein [Enterococcus plantarum]|nr:NAD-dependent epimerase/dehydratase family protein [Enterococcus plantarum]
MNYLITGGSGFIGSNFLNNYVSKHPDINFINIDALTYAGNN